MNGQMWLSRARLWVPPLVLLIAALVLLFVYRSSFAEESAGLEGRLASRQAQLETLEGERAELQAAFDRAMGNRESIQELYGERFSTQRERLTKTLEEVKTLARQAGLDPGSITYPRSEIEDYSLIERQVVFTVEGTYQSLRSFINLLEVSPTFLAIRQVSLTGGSQRGGVLTISLRLSTLFSVDGRAPEVAS